MVAKEIKSKIAAEICRMKSCIGKCPGLAVVLVGQREDSQSFIRLKLRACNEVGISSFVEQLPEDCTEDQVANVVSNLNENPDVHGILVQLPLPQVISATKLFFCFCFFVVFIIFPHYGC